MAADGPLPLMQTQKRPHRHGAAVLPEAPPCGRRTSREPSRAPQGVCCIRKAAPPCECFRRAVGSLKGGAALWAAEPKTEGHPFGCPSVLVPVVGLEPTRYRYQRILSPSRLPIPSHWRWILVYYTRRPPEIQDLFRAARPLPRDSGRSFYEVCSSRIIFRRLFRSDR